MPGEIGEKGITGAFFAGPVSSKCIVSTLTLFFLNRLDLEDHPVREAQLSVLLKIIIVVCYHCACCCRAHLVSLVTLATRDQLVIV